MPPMTESQKLAHPVDHDMTRFEGYQEWDSNRLAQYFSECSTNEHNMKVYASKIKEHHITGELAPLINDTDLKEMGIRLVGDRLQFKKHLFELQKHARAVKRSKPIWAAHEQLYEDNCGWCMYTCCGLLPDDADHYKLTGSHLKIQKFHPYRCLCVKMTCCGGSYQNNNIDLSKIQDIDNAGRAPSMFKKLCCCAHGQDVITVTETGTNEMVDMIVKAGQGQKITDLINNQVEECQILDGSGKGRRAI